MGDTSIQWTEKTWNPIRARRITDDNRGWYCEHVSEGCRNCYAEKMNVNTYFGNGLPYKPVSLPKLEIFLDDKILQQPLHWREPQQIFPCSMTDLFGHWVKDEWLEKIFQVIYSARQHTFQCLTKRPERMIDWISRSAFLSNAPLENLWLGVSVEDQKTADERIPLLLDTPAAVRWISAEPLLSPIDLNVIGKWRNEDLSALEEIVGHVERPALNWVVVGGESGTRARPMRLAWAETIIRQCEAAGVPVFVKQLGKIWANENHAKNPKGGDPDEWPYQHILNRRQFPKAA